MATRPASDGISIDGTPGDGIHGDNTPNDGTPGDGTPGDGPPGDGTPSDGTPGDGPAPADSAEAALFGDRFELWARRGGGMGVIHIAWDRHRQRRVAIKTAQRLDPLTLSLFKNEFRALADIDHRNLVRLYELVQVGERWFFTMEFTDGAPLIEWLRGPTPTALATTAPAPDDTLVARAPADPGAADEALDPPDPERLRAALGQLVEAVAALHRHGLVHRDVKPDNIRVEGDGRLLLLDFGLVVRPDGSAGEGGRGGWIAGTPGYMSPQQAEGRAPTPADDWYAVGAVLCVALCGLRPDRGGRAALARLAAADGPIGELAELGLGLLRPDPATRLDRGALARRLGIRAAVPSGPLPLVGRARERARLAAAAERAFGGQITVCHLWGPSGIGKSALVERFVGDLPADALVLRGRSHRREDVPFGPFDALIDDLARQLADWPRAAVEAVLPRYAGALAHLFPVLDRLSAFGDAPGRDRGASDPRVMRRRALGALRDMLGRIADRRPVAIWLDDVQHGGADSAAMLEVLLAAPDPPPLLVIGCSRRPDGGPLVEAIARAAADGALPVEALPPTEARELAGRLLGVEANHPRAAALADEAGGHPFLLAELSVRSDERPIGTGEIPSLAEAIRARVFALPPAARRALELLALRGRPTPARLLARAATLGDEAPAALRALRAARLVRGGLDLDGPVSLVHDAIGEAVADGLDPEVRAARHRALAEALEGWPPPDAEALYAHWSLGGEPRRAALWALQAGQAAVAATAFEQGVYFLRRAIELGAVGGEPRRALAQALTYAGRPAEAARAWIALAEASAGPVQRMAWRRAAEQHLIAAESDAGRAILDRLLADLGVRRPRGRWGLALATGRQTAALWLAALAGRLDRRRERHADPALAERFDLHLAEVNGLASTHPPEALWSLARASRAGIASGSPTRVALGLAIGHLLVAMSGLPGRQRARERLIAAAHAVAETDERSRPLVRLTEAVVALRASDGERLVLILDALDADLEAAPNQRGWEIGLRRLIRCWSLNLSGRYTALRAQVPTMLADARARGARLEEALLLHFGLVPALLSGDRPAELLEVLERFGAESTTDGHDWVTTLNRLGQLAALRYQGHVGAALAGIRALMLRQTGAPVQRWGDWIREQTAREAINVGLRALGEGDFDDEAIRVTRLAMRVMRRSTWRVAPQWLHAGRAGLDRHAGRTRRALGHLRALRPLLAHGPPRVTPVVDYFEGAWRGGPEGRAMVERARAVMRSQGVVDPDRWVRLLYAAPGPAPEPER